MFALWMPAVLAILSASASVQDSCTGTPLAESIRLQFADGTVERQIDSRVRRNRTGIYLDSGGQYRFTARGKWQDGQRIRPTTARGFDSNVVPWYGRLFMFLGEPIRRYPRARWFALVGELSSRPRKFFVIGDSLVWTAPTTGELVAFANDVNSHYGNNRGCIALAAKRIR